MKMGFLCLLSQELMRDGVPSRIIFVREIMFGDMFPTLSKSPVSDSEKT